MSSKITVEIDPVDHIKLVRLAARIGKTPSEAVRIIHKRGVAFFLALVVGATSR